MWGIGIKKDYNIDAEYVSVKDGIVNEKSDVRTTLMIFGIPLRIYQKQYRSDQKIRKEGTVGFK